MATATVKEVRTGNMVEACAEEFIRIYCKSKSGNVYALRNKVPEDDAPALIARIEAAGVINTTHWVKVREGEKPQRISKDRSFWVRDTEGRPTQVHVRGGLLIAGGAA